MTAQRWTRDVRQRLGLGRLLPLGDARDGAWLAETAARAFLERAVANLPGVRLDAVRIGLADPADVSDPAVPAPPSALPPGRLRVTADLAATASDPLPAAASRVRAALATAATEGLGLRVTEVDLRVVALLDEEPGPWETDRIVGRAGPTGDAAAAGATGAYGGVHGVGADGTHTAAGAGGTGPGTGGEEVVTDEERATAAALAVPGVAGLTGSLGGLGRPVHLEEREQEGTALPHLHARVELAVLPGHRPVEVARAVRTAVAQALPERPTVAVLVTAVG